MSKKSSKIMRVFYINPNSFRLESYKKIEHLQRYIRQKEIDVCMISSSDRKWNTRSENIMKTKMQICSNKTRVITTDSGRVKKTKGNWLPRGTLSCFGRKWTNYIKGVHKDGNSQ